MDDTIDQKSQQASELLKTIAHPLRLQIVLQLTQQLSINVSTLQQRLQTEQSLLSHHLVKMLDRGILRRSRKGKELYYSIADPNIIQVVQLLMASLDRPLSD